MIFAPPLPPQLRLQSLTEEDMREAQAALDSGADLILQFSKPPTDAQLAAVDAFARQAPDHVTARFYGHDGTTPFDMAVLRDLPHVRRFDLDCLYQATNIGVLEELAGLTHLALEIYELTEKDILHRIDAGEIRSLRVGDMKTKAIDGNGLSRFTKLETLFLSNSVKTHAGLRGLPALRDVRLRARPTDSYGFFADCPALTHLEFFLGGAPDMEEVRSDTLTALSVIRCRGVNDLGNLSRFPRLKRLKVDDQIQLEGIDLRGAPQLERLEILNCKALARLRGIEQTALDHLWVHGTQLDLDVLEGMARDWTRLGLFTGRKREDDTRHARLKARGLGLSHIPNAP